MQSTAVDRIYHCREIRRNDFYFRSKHHNVYNIRFANYWQNDVIPLYAGLELELYEVYFEIVELKKQTSDIRVAFTVAKVIDDFLQQGDKVIFFTALREDGRTQALAKLYDLWFNRYSTFFGENRGNAYYYFKRNITSEIEEEDTYFACIINNQTLFESLDQAEQKMDAVLQEIFPSAQIEEA